MTDNTLYLIVPVTSGIRPGLLGQCNFQSFRKGEDVTTAIRGHRYSCVVLNLSPAVGCMCQLLAWEHDLDVAA